MFARIGKNFTAALDKLGSSAFECLKQVHSLMCWACKRDCSYIRINLNLLDNQILLYHHPSFCSGQPTQLHSTKMAKVKAYELQGKSKTDLTKQLDELKKELLQLRVQKVAGASSKLTRM